MNSASLDPQLVERRVAYVETVRKLHMRERMFGFVACAVGVLVMLWGRFYYNTPNWAQWLGLAIIAIGWGLFAYVIVRRTQWVKAHPFEPNA